MYDPLTIHQGTNKSVATQTGTAGLPITFKVDSPKTWSPDSPNLYDVTIKMGEDTVSSYTGFRTVTREDVNGVLRVVLVRLDTVLRRISKGSSTLMRLLFELLR